MAREAADLFFHFTGGKAFGIEALIRSSVPVARGLGFSATIRVGLLAGLNELAKAGLTRDDLLQLATRLEGHPDNASPAVLGGFTVSGTVDDRVRCQRFAVSQRASFVTLIPAREVKTGLARGLLPESYSRADAAHALNRAALITAALSGNQFSHLRGLFDDRIHQPYRERLIPELSRIIRAGEGAGAEGGWLSGSGSSIICLATRSASAVAKAMRREAPGARVCVLQADNRGFTIGIHKRS